MNEVLVLERDLIAEFTNGKQSLIRQVLVVGGAKWLSEVMV